MYNDYITIKLKENGATLVGFADLTVIPEDIRHSFLYGIIIAIALDKKIVSGIPTGPHMDYYNEYKNVTDKLDEICEYSAEVIKQKGFDAFPQSRKFVKQDENYRTLLPHKTIATLAGTGWIGKSAVMVNKDYGSAVRITSVLTNMPFKTGNPITESSCGNCNVCTFNCPGKAIKGNLWHAGIDRDVLVDAKICKKTVADRGKIFNLTEGMCGICFSVCPYTIKYVNSD